MALMDSTRFSNFEVTSYFLEMDAGNNPETPRTVKAFLNDATRKKYEDYKIGTNVTKHAESKNGYAIAYMKDESLLVADLKNYQATQKYASTYEMPQFMQEKFTMLKLLEARQFAENIGIKVCIDADDLGEVQYFIVAGETVVN
jgi:hypothetical protein